MKVSLEGTHLTAIGKTLLPQQTNGESIGMLRFSWFLSAIHGLAQSGQRIDTTNIKGSTWAELDTPEDYEICRELFGNSEMARKRFTAI